MPTANQRISEYVLDQKVGGGTFGEVWKAHHHIWTDQFVAVKIPTDPQYVRNLQTEGAAIHGLVHVNIVRALGFDPYSEPAYLTMEFVPGTNVRDLIKQKTLKTPDAVAIMRQVLAGLSYAHTHGIIHRDIKPENILVHEKSTKEGFDGEGVVKVTDFGLGKAAAKMAVGSIMYSQDMSKEDGQIAGTLDYMAPEQRGGGDVDARADLYACGVMLYELLTGERPAGTEVPSEINPAVPKYLDVVFKRAYTRLEKRYATADEFLKALTTPMPPPMQEKSHGMPPPLRGPIKPPPLHQGPIAPPPPNPPPTGPAGFVVPILDGGRLVCPKCKQTVEKNDQFCMHCGVALTPVIRRCRKCGAYPDGHDRFCIFCGDTLATV